MDEHNEKFDREAGPRRSHKLNTAVTELRVPLRGSTADRVEPQEGLWPRGRAEGLAQAQQRKEKRIKN